MKVLGFIKDGEHIVTCNCGAIKPLLNFQIKKLFLKISMMLIISEQIDGQKKVLHVNLVIEKYDLDNITKEETI